MELCSFFYFKYKEQKEKKTITLSLSLSPPILVFSHHFETISRYILYIHREQKNTNQIKRRKRIMLVFRALNKIKISN